ncbi:MAG: helix-turn-helix transcriptional regulator [Microcoleus sp.]
MPKSSTVLGRLKRAEEQPKVIELYRQGYTQFEIAEQLGIGYATVNRRIRAIRENWEQTAVVDFDAMRRERLESLQAAQLEYWKLYARSQQETVVTTEEESFNDKGGGTKTTTKREKPIGATAALDGVVKCDLAIAKLYGLDMGSTMQAQQILTGSFSALLSALHAAGATEAIQQVISAARQIPEYSEAVGQAANTIEANTRTLTPETLKMIREQVFGVYDLPDVQQEDSNAVE